MGINYYIEKCVEMEKLFKKASKTNKKLIKEYGDVSPTIPVDLGPKSDSKDRNGTVSSLLKNMELSDKDYERDNDLKEEETNLNELIFTDPSPTDECLLHYSISFNKRLFNGWTKQPSPCCAAASVAGGINALLGLGRSDEEALDFGLVLSLYASIFSSSISSLLQSARFLFDPITIGEEEEVFISIELLESFVEVRGELNISFFYLFLSFIS